MYRVFLAQELNEPLLRDFAPLIARADICTAANTSGSRASRMVFSDARWDAATAVEWEVGFSRLADWTQRVAYAQSGGALDTRLKRAVMAAGLDGRLRPTAFMVAFFEYCAGRAGGAPLELDVVTDNPYTRDCFTRGTWSLPPRARTRIHWANPRTGLAAPLREVAATQGWIRGALTSRRVPAAVPAPLAGRKTALVMGIALRAVKQQESMLEQLARRNWRIVIAHHVTADARHIRPVTVPASHVAFDDATGDWHERIDDLTDTVPWALPADLMEDSPLSPFWTRVAMDASWLAGVTAIGRHRSLLDRLQPNVVFTSAQDVSAQALQVAADERRIPTVYLPHGFEVPARQFYLFQTTASAMFGQGCIDHNQRALDGVMRTGLVATGHPPHDAMLDRYRQAKGGRLSLPGLVSPAGRPHIVLGLAGWGYDLLCQLNQERFLNLMADSLPDDAFLVCKLHPGVEEREHCQAVLQARLPPEAFRVVGETEFTTRDLIAACDVAVSNERSAVMAEVVLIGRPCIGIRQEGSPVGVGDCNHPGKDFSDTAWIVETAPELRNAIVALTHDGAAHQRFLAHREAYLRQFLTADGRASERIARLAEHLASGQPPSTFSA
jgi:hypothetical protein